MTQVTISVAASGDDAHIRSDAVASYPPTGAVVDTTDTDPWIAKQFVTPNYRNSIGLVRCNTGAVIPDDATVTAATLQLEFAGGGVDTDNRSLNFEWYPWTTAATGDYADLVGTTANVTDFTTVNAGGIHNFVLSDPAANVSKTGFTGIRMGFSGGAPTGINEVYIRAFDHATLQEPRLVVDYTEAGQIVLPDADIVTTGWATAPLFSKVNDSSDASVITATAS